MTSKCDADLKHAVELAMARAKGGPGRTSGWRQRVASSRCRATSRPYAESWAAELATQRSTRVRAVVNKIELRVPGTIRRTDVDLAADAVAALRSCPLVPAERLKVRVAEGWVTVKGEVDWERQKEAAMDAVRSLRGAVGVTDMVTVRLRESVATEDLKARIGQTSQRVAELDAGRPGVEVDGDRVVLPGTVRSWAEREEAERQARAAPGVREVANQLSVQGIVPVNC